MMPKQLTLCQTSVNQSAENTNKKVPAKNVKSKNCTKNRKNIKTAFWNKGNGGFLTEKDEIDI